MEEKKIDEQKVEVSIESTTSDENMKAQADKGDVKEVSPTVTSSSVSNKQAKRRITPMAID